MAASPFAHRSCRKKYLVVAGGHALLVVGGGLIVGVDDGIRGDTVGVVRLGPGVDGVDVRDILEHGGAEEGEHSAIGERLVADFQSVHER